MVGLLEALLRNESGGRNVVQGNIGDINNRTGDLAKGYFQITTSTWNDFGGQKYAPTPLQATYEQQADIAARIPLNRWGPNTVRAMQATGKPIDPNATLGQNLAANNEDFSSARHVGGAGSGGGYFGGGGAAAPVGSALSDLGDPLLYQFPRSGYDFSTPLADTLSEGTRPPVGGGDSSLAAGMGEPDISPPPEFRPSTPTEAPPPVSATPELAADETQQETPLASLFTVKDFGQARKTDPRTGKPILTPGWGTRG